LLVPREDSNSTNRIQGWLSLLRLNCAVLSLGMTIFMGVPSPQSLLANETHEVSVETPLEITSGQFDRQVLQEIWPGEVNFERVSLPVEGELMSSISKRSRVKMRDHVATLIRVSDSHGLEQGHAVILDEVGKYRPITFLVALNSSDKVLDLQVLVYREHIGQAIESNRFTRQFRDKKEGSVLRLHRDIRNLTGATLSARAAVRAVRRALATVGETVRKDRVLSWRAENGPLLSYGAEELSASIVPASGPADASVGPENQVPEEAHESDSISAASSGTQISVTSGMHKSSETLQHDSSMGAQRARPAMGTILKLEVYGEKAAEALEAAFEEVDRIESLLSRWRPNSDVLRVENAKPGVAVKVDPTTIQIVQLALEAARSSGGVFDPTLVKGGYQFVEVDPELNTISLLQAGLILDLGGIGKGFALDKASEILAKYNCTQSLLDFGGQLLAMEAPPGQDAWDVGIFDPRDGETVLQMIPLTRASLATSARYERGDHLVDLLDTGSATRILSTTILSPKATEADFLSTTVALVGPENAAQVLHGHPGSSAVILVEGEEEPRIIGQTRGE